MNKVALRGVVHALVGLGLVSYQLGPALAVEKSTTFNSQLQWVSQLVIKEQPNAIGTLKTKSASADDAGASADGAAMQRWSAAAQLPMTYKRPMSGGAHVIALPRIMTLDEAQTVAARMEASGEFEYVSPDRIMRPMAVPNDPLFSQQWNLLPPSASAAGGANVTAGWDTTKGVSSVGVGIVDTGIRADHADFAGLVLGTGYNFITNGALTSNVDPKTGNTVPAGFVNNGANNSAGNNDPADPGDWIAAGDATSYPTFCGTTTSNSSWHGTFVAGQIGAQHNNIGIAGIAPGVRVQMARALGKCGGMTSDIMDAMTWLAGGSVPGAANNPTPVNVINMSLGGTGVCSTFEQRRINAVRALNVTIVAATGNEGGPVDAPANCTGVIAVTANTLEGDNASYANVGAQTTISAPGGGSGTVVLGAGNRIRSLSNAGQTAPIASPTGDTYGRDYGTSMATPHVAATAALMLSVQPALTPDDITTLLKQSARPFPAGTYCATHPGVCGAGLLDAGSALTQAQGSPTMHVAAPDSGVTTGTTVTLNAVGGPGYGRATTSTVWAQTDGSRVTLTSSGPDTNGSSSATFTPTTAGVYTFSVTVTNSAGVMATDTTSVTVAGSASSGTGSDTGAGTPSSGGGGGGAFPLWLAGLLLAGGALGLRRHKA